MSTEQVGFTLAAYGAGMIVGASLAARVVARLRFGTVICVGPVTALLASLLMVVTIVWPNAWLAGLSFFLLGVGPIVWVISTTTLRQRVTPAQLLGRVSAINVLAYGARPLGTTIAALLAACYNAELCLVVAALGFALQALIIVCSKAARLDSLP